MDLKDAERYDGDMINRVKNFFEKTLGVKYTACETYIVPQDEINLISPQKRYPNPRVNEIKDYLSKITRIIELSKNCRYDKNHKECPFFETKRLEYLLNQVLNPKKRNTNVVNNINRVNKKLKSISKKFNTKRVHCFNFGDEFCSCDCKGLIEDFRIGNVEQRQYRFELDSDEFDEYIYHTTMGLYLNREHRTNRSVYPKGSVLISEDISRDNGTFEQTFVHEHTHAMLHKEIQGNVISKNIGLNEGFAVAMEKFYADKNGLNFNEKRYGEYLAHQILTILENPNKPKELFEELKKKFGC